MRIAIVIAAAALLAACAKDDALQVSEQTAIKSYLDRSGGYASELPCDSLGGVWRVLENDREGRTAEPQATQDKEVELVFEGYAFNQSLDLNPTAATHPAPFYSNNATIVEEMGVNWPTEPYAARIGAGQLMQGLEMGVKDAYKGDSLLIIMLSERGYGKDAMGSVPQYTPLVFRIVINDVK